MASTKKTNKATKAKKKTSQKSSKKMSLGKKLNIAALFSALIAISIFYWHNNEKVKEFLNNVSNEAINQVHQISDSVNSDDDKYNDLDFFYPTLKKDNILVEHLAYSLAYNEEHEQADWVCYELTSEEAKAKDVKRKNNFKKDPSKTISSANQYDYKNSGYDRGHLCPAADNRWSLQAMNESFYMSNMSPQAPDLNRKIWKDLETNVRDWAIANEELIVVTGPILKDGIRNKIGKSQVSVPKYYYKIVLDPYGEDKKAIAFIFSNGLNKGKIEYYCCSIDTVEERTGIDFFPKMEDSLEDKLESSFDFKMWED